MAGSIRVALTLEQLWHRVPGGGGVAARGMAEGLDRRNDVRVVGISARHRARPPSPWAPSVEVFQLPLPRIGLYESWHRLRRPPVENACGPVDVIHATTIAVPPKSAPLMVTIHDLAFLHDASNFTPRGMRFFLRGWDLARTEADLVMCPSEATARDCELNGLPRARIRVIPLGVDVRRASEDEVSRARATYGLARPYVLWTGTIEPRKNLPRLVEAWSRLPGELDLVLVGPRGWNEDLDRLIGGRGDRVKALGFIPDRDRDAVYAGAELFCWPSLLEGFGFPVLEAMGQATPVITSKGTSTEELAGDAAVVVDPRDSSAIADAMTRVLEDDSLRAKLADSGPSRAGEFTWARTTEMLVRTYEEMAGTS